MMWSATAQYSKSFGLIDVDIGYGQWTAPIGITIIESNVKVTVTVEIYIFS